MLVGAYFAVRCRCVGATRRRNGRALLPRVSPNRPRFRSLRRLVGWTPPYFTGHLILSKALRVIGVLLARPTSHACMHVKAA